MTHLETLLIAAAVILLYSLASMRFSKAVQSLRLRVVSNVNELCDDPSVPDDVKSDLHTIVDNLLSKSAGWLIVVLFPGVVMGTALRGKNPRSTDKSFPHQGKVIQIMAMGLFCMIASSPLCLVLFSVEFLISMLLAGPWAWIRNLTHAFSKTDGKLSQSFTFARH